MTAHPTPDPQPASETLLRPVRLGNAWGVMPFTVLIEPQGRLVKRHIGVFAGERQLRKWIDESLHNPPRSSDRTNLR